MRSSLPSTAMAAPEREVMVSQRKFTARKQCQWHFEQANTCNVLEERARGCIGLAEWGPVPNLMPHAWPEKASRGVHTESITDRSPATPITRLTRLDARSIGD